MPYKYTPTKLIRCPMCLGNEDEEGTKEEKCTKENPYAQREGSISRHKGSTKITGEAPASRQEII